MSYYELNLELRKALKFWLQHHYAFWQPHSAHFDQSWETGLLTKQMNSKLQNSKCWKVDSTSFPMRYCELNLAKGKASKNRWKAALRFLPVCPKNAIPLKRNSKMRKHCSFEKEQQNAEVMFLWKGTAKCGSVVLLKRNNKMRKCCSFGKEQQNAEVLFLWNGIAKCRSVVPLERNNKNVKVLFLSKEQHFAVPLKGTVEMRKCCSFERNNRNVKVLFLWKEQQNAKVLFLWKEQQKCTIIKCKHAKNELVVHWIDAEDGLQFEGSNTWNKKYKRNHKRNNILFKNSM